MVTSLGKDADNQRWAGELRLLLLHPLDFEHLWARNILEQQVNWSLKAAFLQRLPGKAKVEKKL